MKTRPVDSTKERLEIRDFSPSDFDDAAKIAFRLWGAEFETPPTLAPKLYEYLVRYYFESDSPFNLSAFVDGVLSGILLAAPVSSVAEETDVAARFAAEAFAPEEREYFETYRAYLDANRRKEREAAAPNETILLFFASVRPGCGRALKAEFERRLRERGGESYLLWTDETCDFDYYYRNGFAEVDRFELETKLAPKPLRTFLFRKKLECD